MDDWDRPSRPAPHRRPLALVALLALAVAGGLLVRAGAGGGSTGGLDVEPETTGDPPPAESPADEIPSATRDDEEPDGGGMREPGGPRGPAQRDAGELPPDGKARAEGADGEAAPGGSGAGSWELLPEAPVAARSGHTLAWSGDELLVWGGAARDGGARDEFFADGAAYDPGAGRWRSLPPAPLGSRSGHAAVWTGGELVVWGGLGSAVHFADGAAYDPDADAWRPIAPSPLSPRQRPAAVWTGDELLVLGGSDFAGALRDAAAYSPAEDAWRPVADLPEEFSPAWNLDGTWTGEAAIVWAEHADNAAPAIRYEPSTDRWELLPPVTRRGPVTAAWTGEDLLALRGSLLVSWRPGAEDWESREPPWGSSEPWVQRAHWTGEHLLAVRGANRPRVDVYDPEADRWEQGATSPGGVGFGPSVWSGTALLTWGGSEFGMPANSVRGAAFRPGGGE